MIPSRINLMILGASAPIADARRTPSIDDGK